jgi:hypothetical protein
MGLVKETRGGGGLKEDQKNKQTKKKKEKKGVKSICWTRWLLFAVPLLALLLEGQQSENVGRAINIERSRPKVYLVLHLNHFYHHIPNPTRYNLLVGGRRIHLLVLVAAEYRTLNSR